MVKFCRNHQRKFLYPCTPHIHGLNLILAFLPSRLEGKLIINWALVRNCLKRISRNERLKSIPWHCMATLPQIWNWLSSAQRDSMCALWLVTWVLSLTPMAPLNGSVEQSNPFSSLKTASLRKKHQIWGCSRRTFSPRLNVSSCQTPKSIKWWLSASQNSGTLMKGTISLWNLFGIVKSNHCYLHLLGSIKKGPRLWLQG